MDPLSNMFKQWMLCAGATVAMVLPGAGQASAGRIGFIGAVTTPTCTLIVRGVGASLIVNGIGNRGSTTLNLPGAAGTFFSISAADCDGAVDTTKMGAANLASIYFESVNSVELESDGIISIVYK
jgi:type 1 fimbria pilin